MNTPMVQVSNILRVSNEYTRDYFNKGKVMKNTNVQEIKELVEAVKQVAEVVENRTYKLGDEVKAYGKNCKIVEVLDVDRYHLKNLQEPYDSFVALVEEFE